MALEDGGVLVDRRGAVKEWVRRREKKGRRRTRVESLVMPEHSVLVITYD